LGLAGVAAGMAITTAVVLAAVLLGLRALRLTLRGVVLSAIVCGGVAAVAFGVPRLVLGPVAAAVLGLALYAAAVGLWRPPGLRHAWAYVRALQ
jgi:hypothetical protein